MIRPGSVVLRKISVLVLAPVAAFVIVTSAPVGVAVGAMDNQTA